MTTKLNVKIPEVTAPLPFGFTARFRFANGIFSVAWAPHTPVIKSARARKKFTEAYWRARDEYMQIVATGIGTSVLTLDDSPTGICRTHVADPAERH
jgi:hypothetical protein